LIGDRYYLRATATISDDLHSVSVSAFARESLEKKGMDTAQITGAASSYARKYALNGLFCIDDTKDADTTDNRNGQVTAPVEFIDEKEQSQILDYIADLGVDMTKFLAYAKVSKIVEITKTDFPKIIAALEAKRKMQGNK
jgi:hypothetical protein